MYLRPPWSVRRDRPHYPIFPPFLLVVVGSNQRHVHGVRRPADACDAAGRR